METWMWLLIVLGVWLLGLASAVRAYFLGYDRAEAQGTAEADTLRAIIRRADAR